MASENEMNSNDTNEMECETVTDNKETEEIVLPTSKSSKGIIKDPNFAVVCSFIKIFGPLLHFQELSIKTLQQFFDTPTQANQEDIQALFIKLLRRSGWRVIPDKWEKGLLKCVKEFDVTIAWDLEQFGFRELTGEAKLAILKHLLESQFDYNDKFKTAINSELTQLDLRPNPLGSDIDGLIYWFHEDELLQLSLYSTEEDELDCEAWKVLACEVDEIMDVVQYLEKKSEKNPKDDAQEKKEEKRQQRALKKQENGKKAKGKKSKKRARESIDESDEDDDNPCARCYSGVRPEWILLCDKCDAAYHTACLRPPLMQIPDGDWFCPYCNTLALIEKLKAIHTRMSTRIKARSRALNSFSCWILKLYPKHCIPQSLKQPDRRQSTGINLANIRQSGRVRKTVDYTFSEFDQEILDAVDRDGRKSKPSAEPSQSIAPPPRGIRQSKRRMLYNDSDSDSNYDPGSPMVEKPTPKRPERHVYLRRHEVQNGDSCDEITTETEKQEDALSDIYSGSARKNHALSSKDEDKTKLDDKNSNAVSISSIDCETGLVDKNMLGDQSLVDEKDSVNTICSTSDTRSDVKLSNEGKNSSTINQLNDTCSFENSISCDQIPVVAERLVGGETSSMDQNLEQEPSSFHVRNETTSQTLTDKVEMQTISCKDSSQSSTGITHMKTNSPEKNILNDCQILNGKECTRSESNYDTQLNSRDINLVTTQEDEQPDLIQKNPDYLDGSQTTTIA